MSNLSTSIATTREQSERLLAMGVNPETADCFLRWIIEEDWESYETSTIESWMNNKLMLTNESIKPAWSLSRLISMMPHYIYSIPYHLSVSHGLVKYTHPSVGDKIGFCQNSMFDNCVSMIDWLIKNNHFNKEYLK